MASLLDCYVGCKENYGINFDLTQEVKDFFSQIPYNPNVTICNNLIEAGYYSAESGAYGYMGTGGHIFLNKQIPDDYNMIHLKIIMNKHKLDNSLLKDLYATPGGRGKYLTSQITNEYVYVNNGFLVTAIKEDIVEFLQKNINLSREEIIKDIRNNDTSSILYHFTYNYRSDVLLEKNELIISCDLVQDPVITDNVCVTIKCLTSDFDRNKECIKKLCS